MQAFFYGGGHLATDRRVLAGVPWAAHLFLFFTCVFPLSSNRHHILYYSPWSVHGRVYL